MKTLNLVDSEKSDIKYKISKFPDGQQNIVVDLNYKYNTWIIKDSPISFLEPVQIKSRLNNWLDLELITCAVASLRELGVEEIHLYTPYIIGARSDRKFEEGGNNYVKHVIAPAINNLKLKSVTCIDPHSDVLEACINRFRKLSNNELVKWTLLQDSLLRKLDNEIILVSPDAGASKKIYKLAEQIGYKGDIITCSKDRDKEGKLTKTIVPIDGNNLTKDVIIIDDIYDGGRTFINIAEKLKSYKEFKGKIYLIVTHGIFSKGFHELAKYFDSIYCTNSYKDIDLSQATLVKQLNVF